KTSKQNPESDAGSYCCCCCCAYYYSGYCISNFAAFQSAMALGAAESIWVGLFNSHSNPLLSDSSGPSRHGLVSVDFRCRKWQCCWSSVVLAHTTLTPVDDDKKPLAPQPNPPAPTADSKDIIVSKGFHRDLNFLPKPLSVNSTDGGPKVRVAYQGIAGAYSEAAALKAYPGSETVPCYEFEAAFKAVELWLVDKAVLPIENSVGGSIHRNYDLLLRHRLHIVGEVQLEVNHCLLTLPGVKKEELKRVLSHPQALAQCETTLSSLNIIRVNSEDTAGAAQVVAASGQRDTGAIASARAAEIYGLDILAKNIQDDADNITRFLILAREPIIPGTDKPYRTSIVFTLEEGPGVLFKALAVFALRDISLTKIESRPQRRRPVRVVDDSNKGSAKYFDYLFYIDFAASMAEHRAQHALGHLQEFAKFIRVLGSYPMDTIS
ncbi:Arogenate dehydratase/prephenate dehydratase 1, chloroplastic, partial [Linum grandiflorum]